MGCSECGSENCDTARFCVRCRATLERLCPWWQAENPPSHDFCDVCGHGHDLRTPAELRSIDSSGPRRYAPRHLAEEILATRSTPEGERKRSTVLFADVVDYAGLAQKLDFTGDGIMAIFGDSWGVGAQNA